MKRAAGILLFVPDTNSALFVRRSRRVSHPGEWAFPGGMANPGESLLDAARRETLEEIGAIPSSSAPVGVIRTVGKEAEFTTFLWPVRPDVAAVIQQLVELNWESDGVVWAPLTSPPSPIHRGAAQAVAAALRFLGRTP